MSESFARARFLIVHMTQSEVLLTFFIAAALLWILNIRLKQYSTKTGEAALSRWMSFIFLLIAPALYIAGRLFR